MCARASAPQTLDQTELQGDGVSLSLEEQLSALCLGEPSAHDPEDTVSLNGSRFASRLFEDATESTKVTRPGDPDDTALMTEKAASSGVYGVCYGMRSDRIRVVLCFRSPPS